MTSLQWVCFEVFCRSNSIFQLYYVCNHTNPGQALPSNRLNVWQLPFSISEKCACSVSTNYMWPGRAGVEPATPGSAVRLAVDDSRLSCNVNMSRRMAKPTKWSLRSAKTQICLGIRLDWSESSLSAWRNIGSSTTHWAHCEDSDQTGRMPRLIWVFAGRKGHFVDFVMRWLTFRKCILIFASGLRNKPHFWRPGSLAQSTVSLAAKPSDCRAKDH